MRNKRRLTKGQTSLPGESPGFTILKILYNSVYRVLQTENARSKIIDCTFK